MRVAISFRFLIGIFLLLFAGAIVDAHTVGASWEKQSGSYLIDVGYDAPSIVAGQSVRFDFNLWKDSAESASADFVHVWVRIIKDKGTLLATGIYHQSIGPTTLLYTFADAGSYTLEASFRNAGGDELASALFPITVSEARETFPIYVLYAAVFLLGAGGVWLFRYLPSRSKS